jgi:polysaccharide pyruvyl transferase WcaK-like protein
MVKEHDIVLLVEGSCYTDYWTSVLLWVFLYVSKCAYKYGKPTLAYAVDSGILSDSNQRKVQRVASNTDLIIARTAATAEHLRSIGVSAPIEVTADTGFTFQMNPKDSGTLQKVWKPSKSDVVGLSVLDFHLWPVVIRLFGKKEHCYQWPYYFSRSSERCAASEDLAKHWAAEADRIITEYNKSIALLCMEQLDEQIAREIHKRMKHSNHARIFSSREYNASQMTGILRSLDLLLTSRYHASVLSLAARIPQVAISGDTRLKRLYADLGLFKDYFIEQGSPNMWGAVKKQVDNLLSDPTIQNDKLKVGYKQHLARAKRNRELLKEFINNHTGV